MTQQAASPGISRRSVLRFGVAGLSLADWLLLRSRPAAGDTGTARSFGRAKSCIVLFAWGGMSHLDTFDLKPEAASDTRSAFRPIATRTPGIQLCEHLPYLAAQTEQLAIVRSVHHRAPAHRAAAYWNLTGHEPPRLSANWVATRSDWPCLGSLVWQAETAGQRRAPQPHRDLPGAVTLPYPMYDGGHANGQDAGFLGLGVDPVILRPQQGVPYEGKSPDYGHVDLSPLVEVDRERLISRRSLFQSLDARRFSEPAAGVERYQQQALDLLLAPQVRRVFDLDTEPAELRDRYGRHICGQSVLLARKLTEAGVPLVTVICSAGDLNGSAGANWDTHGDGFRRLAGQMLPPLDQASSALLVDLAQSGRLDETLVVWLTEFGRTPRTDGAGGRDHYPNVYSVAFAGAGIAGGQVLGSSNALGAEPHEHPCGPADLHATIFHALGIDPHFTIQGADKRPLPGCDGRPLPLFG